jgi:hypothetical protein
MRLCRTRTPNPSLIVGGIPSLLGFLDLFTITEKHNVNPLKKNN